MFNFDINDKDLKLRLRLLNLSEEELSYLSNTIDKSRFKKFFHDINIENSKLKSVLIDKDFLKRFITCFIDKNITDDEIKSIIKLGKTLEEKDIQVKEIIGLLSIITENFLKNLNTEKREIYIAIFKRILLNLSYLIDSYLLKKEKEIYSLYIYYSLLSDINMLAIKVDTLDRLFSEAIKILTEKGNFLAANVFNYIKEKNSLKPVYISGTNEILRNIPREIKDTFDITKITSKSTDFFKKHPAFYKALQKENIKSIVFIPIFKGLNPSKENISMVLAVYSAYKPSDKELNFFRDLSLDLSFAYERISTKDYASRIDKITLLPTREVLIEELQRTIRDYTIKEKKFALLVIDIDNFKLINEKFGYGIGDVLLRSIAGRIKSVLKSEDFLCRISKDEFGIILREIISEDSITVFLPKLYRAFNTPFVVGKEKFFISVSTGIGIFPDDGRSIEKIMLCAELALEKAKNQGNTFSFYKETLSKKTFEIIKLESQLKTAIEKKEFVIFYQPKIDIENYQVIGAEALVRWKKNGKVISPAKFIPILEKTGMIKKLGIYVIKQVLLDIKRWKNNFNIPVSINISPLEIEDKTFINSFYKIIDENKDYIKNIEIEITETTLMQNIENISKVLKQLKINGVKTIIDDFGTGYSSLLYLKKLPVFALKIDKEFIKGIVENQDDFQIVKTIINLAKNFGLTTIAEGVETKAQLNVLKFLGCNIVQGFLFSKPLPSDEFEKYIHSFYHK